MIEADFQREYGINLNKAITEGMTWRRFIVLLGNFGPNSITINVLADKEDQPLEGEDAAVALEQW